MSHALVVNLVMMHQHRLEIKTAFNIQLIFRSLMFL